MKKILIISSTYPPSNDIGGRRWDKFSKYLNKAEKDVYLLTRASFITLPISYFQTSAIYGRKPFFAVALPLARPAIIAGLALVLMETISDFGTVDYFAIETLTLGVFNVWLGMNSLSGAAQISSILFFIVVILLTLELIARRNQRFYEKHSRQESQDLEEISNFQKILFFITCLIPLILGFIIPVSVLLNFVLKGYAVVNISEVVDTAITSISISFVASTTIMLLSFVMVVVATYKSNTFQKSLIFLYPLFLIIDNNSRSIFLNTSNPSNITTVPN